MWACYALALKLRLALLEVPVDDPQWQAFDPPQRRRRTLEAVKHLLLARLEGRPARLDLTLYPHLPVATVTTTKAADYLALLAANPQGGE